MSTISGLYERFRLLIHEGAKFLLVGLVGTIVTFGVANALQDIGKYKAITIATILATVVTYLGNGRWAFRNRQGQGATRDSIVFFVLNGIGLLIYWGCIGLTDLAGLGDDKLWYNAALVVGTGLGTLFRFWSYRKWVWVASDTPVLAEGESAEDRAQDLAAMVGAAPITHHGSGEDGGRAPGHPRTPGSHRRS
ncbi:MAG TPA: GtrA family protein [Streptosporangiaceae bacterium]|nr:GtrA family protein [Streptosporangiaceae bacterium]